MNDKIEVDRVAAEELEVLLRMIARASSDPEDFRALQAGGLSEAADVFADMLESSLEDAREGYPGGAPE